MLKIYQTIYSTYYNDGRLLHRVYSNYFIKEENEIENKEIKITWDNLDLALKQYGLILPFNVWNLKKYIKICFFNSVSFFGKNHFKTLKSNKDKLNLTVKEEHQEQQISLQEILKIKDSEKVIQYLKEKDLKLKVD